MALFATHFNTPFFCNRILHMKRILHMVSVKIITFKSSNIWFKTDILWLLKPPTAILSHFQSHLNYYIYIHNIKPKLSAKHVFTVRE